MPKGALPVVTAGQDPHRHWAPSFEAQLTDLPPSTSMIGVVIPGTHCIVSETGCCCRRRGAGLG